MIGVTHTINAFLPLLRAGKTKRILIVTSSMGSPEFARTTQYVEAPCYSISKSALNMVIVKFAAALKDEGFVVLGVSPGLVNTLPGCKHLYFYVAIFFLIFDPPKKSSR